MSFTKKRLDIELALASGQFQGGGNIMRISGLRIRATVEYFGGPDDSKMMANVYGIPLDKMNQLSTVGTQLNAMNKNGVALYAGEEGGEMALVFEGNINVGMVDAQAMPQVNFSIAAGPGSYDAVLKNDPLSIKGNADAAQMMQQLAGKMGLQFENNGVDTKLSNPYYAGNPFTQAQRIARAGNFSLFFEKGTMVISKRGKPRAGDPVKISRETGMVGYPAFNQYMLIVRTQFNPNYKMSGLVEVESDITPANGQWMIKSVTHELESETPKGKWYTLLELVSVGTQ